MDDEIWQVLQDSVPGQIETQNFSELWLRARRQRRLRQGIAAISGLALLGAVAFLPQRFLASNEQPVEVVGQPSNSPTGPSGEPSDQRPTGPEVEGKWEGSPTVPAHAWAAWTDTEEGLRRLWDDFHLETPPPTLEGQAILMAATGESGSCPLNLRQVRVDSRSVALTLVAEAPSDADTNWSCTDDFNPVTFVIRVSRESPPPLMVDFGDTAVRVATKGEVASANHGERP